MKEKWNQFWWDTKWVGNEAHQLGRGGISRPQRTLDWVNLGLVVVVLVGVIISTLIIL